MPMGNNDITKAFFPILLIQLIIIKLLRISSGSIEVSSDVENQINPRERN